ncbi:MAG: choice-of-anchor D domain-containing protein [Planctomycetes bacterium]|nr:choice-of-anchor D domain-containing protein [Planctomycetota bacterium]
MKFLTLVRAWRQRRTGSGFSPEGPTVGTAMKRLYRVTAALMVVLASCLMFTGTSAAATRVFYDGFESGNTNLWDAGAYPRAQVVTTSTDGVLGPYAGTYMARCNWNGSVVPFVDETLVVTASYTNEVFYRVRLRVDQNVDRTVSSPAKILRIFVQAGAPTYNVINDMYSVIPTWDALRNEGTAGGVQFATYWGDAPGDTTASTASWHEVEWYFNHTTGKIKVWHDGILVRDLDAAPGFGGGGWTPFALVSNWGDPHDAVNHAYFDDVEIFSDSATGEAATGSMANGDIQVGGGGTAPEINVTGKGLTIMDGDTSPSTSDNTDFGSQSVASGAKTKTYTVQNTGTAALTVGSVTLSGAHAADFTVTLQPATSVAAGGSTTFKVKFNPSATGLRSASVSFTNNDADENPYNFSIQGTGI